METKFDHLYKINNPLLKTGEELKIYSLSDIQLLQTKLLEYEEYTRIILPKLSINGNLINKEMYKQLEYDKQEILMIESCNFIIDQYYYYIKKNIDNFNTFIDLGDFIFNITNNKIELLYKY
jgi:hypothetical protein